MNVLSRPLWAETGRTVRMLRRLVLLYALGAALGVGVMTVSRGLGGVVVAGLLVPLAGLAGSWPLMAARHRLVREGLGSGERLSRMARRPQGMIVPAIGVFAVAAVWWGRPWGEGAGVVLGGATIVLGFPLLVAERVMAGVTPVRLPEAPGLQALLLVPVLAVPLAGLAQVAGGSWAGPVTAAVGAYLGVVAAELCLRALANWFLPPPGPLEARASVESWAALLLQPRRIVRAAPLRTHLGLDFARSWTLRYVRGAALPMLCVLGLMGWGLSGVSLIELDRRGVYERFGAPVSVWAPGIHLGLPWPLGRVRRVELGVVHAVPLGGEEGVMERGAAEAAAPAGADRLWDRVHPTEVSTLIASRDASGGQGFQVVSVDLRVLYRAGLGDAEAVQAAYRVAAPETLIRAEAGRLLAQAFAGETLAGALAENRATQAARLRDGLQGELDRLGTGIEVVGVVIEAIHPPLAAAEAYHNVQAAEIVAHTAVATERGRAMATAAVARQNATEAVMVAQGVAAETVGRAAVMARGFAADHAAAETGRGVFLLERYFANVAAGLAKSPLVIVDHRLGGADGPVIDLRSYGAPPVRPADDD